MPRAPGGTTSRHARTWRVGRRTLMLQRPLAARRRRTSALRHQVLWRRGDSRNRLRRLRCLLAGQCSRAPAAVDVRDEGVPPRTRPGDRDRRHEPPPVRTSGVDERYDAEARSRRFVLHIAPCQPRFDATYAGILPRMAMLRQGGDRQACAGGRSLQSPAVGPERLPGDDGRGKSEDGDGSSGSN